MKWYIKAMSLSQKDIQARLDEDAFPLVEHLIKYFCYPNHESSDHWVTEIYAFVKRVPKFKNNNKLPSSDFIFYCLWETSIDSEFSTMYLNIMDEYGYSDSDEISVRNKIVKYLHWLSDILSSKGVSNRSDVRNYLKKLRDE